MSRFVIWSDLHMEHQGFDIPSRKDFNGPFDGVLLAGDIDTGMSLCHLHFAKKIFDAYGVPVVLVLGNHEFYGCEVTDFLDRQEAYLKYLQAEGYEIYVLDGDAVTIDETRIVGATLWTNFGNDPASVKENQELAERWMNDYRFISKDQDGIRPLNAADTLRMHEVQKQAIYSHLSLPHDGPTIVMTHHMPILQAVHEKYLDHPLNASFASDLMHEIQDLDFDAWVYGHSHDNHEVELQIDKRVKRFISNPRGYPNEVTRFDPLRILEV